jgi:flavin reductase (DIM6/NTAB) family NADH-FMN oxidoreductase RutF
MELLPCNIISAPGLARAAVSMECQLFAKKEIFNNNEDHTTSIVMGCLVKLYVHESVLKEVQLDDAPLVDLTKLQAVGNAGDFTY